MHETLTKIKITLTILVLALCVVVFLLGRQIWGTYNKGSKGCGVIDDTSTLVMPIASEEYQRGETIFKENCERCHYASDKKLTGPGFKDILDRVESDQWLRSYIGNSDSVIASGHPYAVDLHEKYGNQKFNHNYRFTDADWKSLLLYITKQSEPIGDPM